MLTQHIRKGAKPFAIQLGNRIRTARKNAKCSVEMLAEHCGVTRTSVNQWEVGVTMPTVDKFPRLATSLGVSADWLLGLIEEGDVEANLLAMIGHLNGDALSLLSAAVQGMLYQQSRSW